MTTGEVVALAALTLSCERSEPRSMGYEFGTHPSILPSVKHGVAPQGDAGRDEPLKFLRLVQIKRQCRAFSRQPREAVVKIEGFGRWGNGMHDDQPR